MQERLGVALSDEWGMQPMNDEQHISGPHQGTRILQSGMDLPQARGVMLLVHGRGASAESILQLAAAVDRPDWAYIAPQAAGHTWYPYSFLQPLERNEPHLSSALALLADVLRQVSNAGVSAERVVLLGFSQGACLTLEFAARNAQRYGGIAGLSGGLIGPEGTPRDYPGSLDGTPVFLGCSDVDAHIPVERVHETARVLSGLGGVVDERIYPGMGHEINLEELQAVQQLMAQVG
jgi:predicted esterase